MGLLGLQEYIINKMDKSKIDKIKAANNIFYILELNKFDMKDIIVIFNNIIKMKKDKDKGDFF